MVKLPAVPAFQMVRPLVDRIFQHLRQFLPLFQSDLLIGLPHQNIVQRAVSGNDLVIDGRPVLGRAFRIDTVVPDPVGRIQVLCRIVRHGEILLRRCSDGLRSHCCGIPVCLCGFSCCRGFGCCHCGSDRFCRSRFRLFHCRRHHGTGGDRNCRKRNRLAQQILLEQLHICSV